MEDFSLSPSLSFFSSKLEVLKVIIIFLGEKNYSNYEKDIFIKKLDIENIYYYFSNSDVRIDSPY